MLTWASPAAFAFGALGLLIVLFYFLRQRFRRQPVSSDYLWRALAQTADGGARVRRRSVLLLLLQLAAAAALTAALAGPVWTTSEAAEGGTVLLIDPSASLGAVDGLGPRTEQVRRAVEAELAAGTGPWALWTGAGVERLGSGEVRSKMNAWSAGTGGFDDGRAAAAVGAWLARNPGRWAGILVTDGGADREGRPLAALFADRWKVVTVGQDAANLGLVGLTVDPQAREARLSVFWSGPEPAETTLRLRREGGPDLRRSVSVPPGTSAVTFALPAEGLGPGVWTAERTGAPDGLAADDRVQAAVPEPRPARILHLGPPDPYLRAAAPGADLVDRTSPTLEGGPWDLVLVTGAFPAGAPAAWGEPVAGPAEPAAGAPAAARWVPWSDLLVTSGRGLVLQAGAEVLAEVGGVPVAATWVQNDVRFGAWGLSPAGSNLGLTPVLPVLVRNLRQAAVPQEENPLAGQLRVGTTGAWAGGPGWSVEPGVDAVRSEGLWRLTARRPGAFRWTEGPASGWLTAVLPAGESDLAPRPPVAAPERAGSTPAAPLRRDLPLTALLVLAALGALAAEWRLWNGRFRPGNRRRLAGLRLAAALAAAAALAGLRLPWPTDQRSVVLLLDTSASVGSEGVAQARTAAAALIDALDPGDRAAVAAFDSAPRLLAGLQPRDQAGTALDAAALGPGAGGETDVGGALAWASALAAGEPGASVYLFSDGRPTRGPALADLGAPAVPWPVYPVPVGTPRAGASEGSLTLPRSVRPGAPVEAVWQVWSDTDQPVLVEQLLDGRPVDRRADRLTAGLNRRLLGWPAGTPGTATVEVRVTDPEGRPLPAAGAGGLLTVEGPASVLVVGPAGSSPVAGALEAQGLRVRRLPPGGLPEAEAGFAGASAVVLDNIAAGDLSAGQQTALATWVTGGGGLLVVGGPRSLGRGEYASSALEPLLPVQTDTRQRLQFTRTKLLFVIDHSGSMSEQTGTSTKLQAALRGVVESVKKLSVQDEVGILQFDTEAEWLLPFTPVKDRRAAEKALTRLGEGGGTDLTAALKEVAQAFGRPGPVRRHVVLLTDGQTGSDPEFYRRFTATMRAAGVSLTVLGIGDEVNTDLLKALADESGGLYYRAQGDDIPALLEKETVRVTRDLMQEGTFLLRAVARDKTVDLGTEPPPVLGYLVTRPKPLGRVLWEVVRDDGGRDPVYAEGRAGSGRVGVFTADSGERWLKLWAGRPEYNRFWAQAVRSLDRAAAEPGLTATAELRGSELRVTAEAVDGSRRLRGGLGLLARAGGREQPMQETAPGRYEAVLEAGDPGLALVTVTERAGGASAQTWVWRSPGAEAGRTGADWAALGRLAARTGGLLEPASAPEPPARRWSWTSMPLTPALLLAALVLFCVELGYRSTRLGQLAEAWRQLSAWWAGQRRPWTKRIAVTVSADAAGQEARTLRAYRFLALRRRPGSEPPGRKPEGPGRGPEPD